MFQKACDHAELIEGKYDVAVVDRTLCLIIWPQGGEPRAFQGMCPHAKEPLADARFDGKNLECHHHDWLFDGVTGKCLKGKPCNLSEYPLKVEDGVVFIDVEGIAPTYLEAPPKQPGMMMR
jgi:toluene monooxygenase system ferredoxin subunit